MTRIDKIINAALVAYALGFFFTFGKVYAENTVEHSGFAGINAGIAAAFWPIYVPCRVSIWLFTPAPPSAPEAVERR